MLIHLAYYKYVDYDYESTTLSYHYHLLLLVFHGQTDWAVV